MFIRASSTSSLKLYKKSLTFCINHFKHWITSWISHRSYLRRNLLLRQLAGSPKSPSSLGYNRKELVCTMWTKHKSFGKSNVKNTYLFMLTLYSTFLSASKTNTHSRLVCLSLGSKIKLFHLVLPLLTLRRFCVCSVFAVNVLVLASQQHVVFYLRHVSVVAFVLDFCS